MGAEVCRRPIERIVPAGWHCRIERPIRLSEQDSEPVPDLSIVRGGPGDYADRHPEPADVALIVEVAKTSLQQDREQSVILGAVGISVYWVVNLEDRQLEVYAGPVAGPYPPPTILDESASVELEIDGQVVGQIAVADLLPPRP